MLWSVIRVILKTSSVTPDFFYVSNLVLSFSTCSQSFNKICVWEVLGANPPQVVFRHSTVLPRILLARCVDSRSDFLELPEKKWRERHFICFGFVSYRRCFLHSQLPFYVVRHFVCFSARLAVHYFAVYSVLGSPIKQISTATTTSAMAV